MIQLHSIEMSTCLITFWMQVRRALNKLFRAQSIRNNNWKENLKKQTAM